MAMQLQAEGTGYSGENEANNMVQFLSDQSVSQNAIKKLINNGLDTIDHLKSIGDADIDDLCKECGIKTIQKIKLKTAIKKLKDKKPKPPILIDKEERIAITKMAEKVKTIENAINLVADTTKNIDAQVTNHLSLIQSTFKELHESLDQRQQELIKKLKKIAHEKKEKLQNISNALNQQHNASKQKLQECTERVSKPTQIHEINSRIEQISNIANEVDKIKIVTKEDSVISYNKINILLQKTLINKTINEFGDVSSIKWKVHSNDSFEQKKNKKLKIEWSESKSVHKPDPNDRYLIANNPADIVWIENNERKYKITKSSINYDRRIYIDIPFEADDLLRNSSKHLNELRPLNQFDRVSETRREEILQTQKKCIFFWIRYWCIKVIQRRTAVPSFIKFEQFYQVYFAQVMNRYIACNIHCDEDVFSQCIHALHQIEFVGHDQAAKTSEKSLKHDREEQKSINEDKNKNKKKKNVKRKQPHTPLWDCYDRWATQNILKYYTDTLKEIDSNTNIYINAKNDEALKQAARCLNKLRPKYSTQINALSQDALFKINYWKRNAHFCLVRYCVRRCIEQRLSVPNKICNVNKELKAYFTKLKQQNIDVVEPKYENDDKKEENSRLLQLEEYMKIKDIVVKFDSLFLDSVAVEFDNLLIECSEIILNVPDDILGIDEKEFKQNIKVAQITGKGNSVYITDKADGGRFHRVYFFSPFLAYKTHPLHVQLNDISPQLYKMCKVFEKNQHLLFLDICIPWKILQLSSSSLNVTFHYQTDKGWIMTPAGNRLENNSRGFYCIHKQTQTESLLGSFSRMFKKFTSNEYSAQKSAETAIVQHLLSDITDWGSYRYSRMIMNSLNIIPEHYKNMWKQQLKYVETKPNLVNVHKLQLLKSINPKNLPDLEAQHVFFITRACLEEEKSVLLENEYNQQTIGIAIYNSFVGDLRRILNYVPSHLITTSDRICLFPSFNFFRYFQDLKERINEAKRQQQRQKQGGYYYSSSSGYNYNNYNNRLSDYELKRVDFNKDMDWIEENMVDVLDVDLRIAMFQSRPWPLETIILNFCKTLKKNDKDGTGRMIEIFARLSTIKASRIIFRRIFNNTKNVNCIFYLLHIDFVNWIKFCHCIGEEFIKKNKRVHRIFIERLEKKIEALQNMKQLNDLLSLLKEFKILNRLVIRMKLLRNISLLETADWREAVNIIMQIVWKHARIDEDNADMLQHCTAELLFNLLKRENQREFGLKLFISPPETEMDEAKLDDEEDDLYASSDDEITVVIPVVTSLDDEDTKLAIALSKSEAEKKENEIEAKIEEKDDAKDDEKEPISVKERELNDIERGRGEVEKNKKKVLAVVVENASAAAEEEKDDKKEKEKAALPIVPRRKKKKKKKEKAKLVNKVHVFEKACMESLEQILMTKNSIPDKIAMFCGHEVFYELPPSMHVLYVDLVMNGANKDLAKWGDEDTLKIKQISMQYGTIDHAKGVTLWELLLDKLIHLPLDMVEEEHESDEEPEFVSGLQALVPAPIPAPAPDISHLPAFLQQLILQQGQIQAPVPAPIPGGLPGVVPPPPPPPVPPRFGGNISGIEARQRVHVRNDGKRVEELQNEFLEQISYCISCQPWIEFAMEMKHLFPMGNLLKFINNKLDKLQMEMSYHTLSMLCADLLRNEEQRFKKLLIEIKHRMCYDDEVDNVIMNYRHWYKLREHLIIMFRRYIKIDDTAGKDIKELNHFLEYLKQWNYKSIMDIDEKLQWKLLQEHEEILNVLNQRQESKVFLRLWYDKRLDIEREQKVLYERYRIKKNIVQGKDDEEKQVDDVEEKILDFIANESEDDVEELYVGRSGRRRFHFQQVTHFEWSFELYMTELFAEACETWDTLVTSVSNRKLKIADLDWFIDLELSKELKIMKLPVNVISKVHLYAGEALKLQPLLRFTSDLVQVVQLIVEYMRKIDTERVKKGGKAQCNILEDKNWKGLVKKLESGRKLQRDQPIADAAKMYEDVSKSIGIDFTKLHRNWLSTLLSKKHIVVEMATNADFADTARFEEMLRLLDDANNAMMAQLSGALRSVKRLLRQNLLDQSFPHYTALMRYLAGLSLREQDLTDLAQVGDSLQNIQRVVEDAGKTAAVRDMKILESAMKQGYFLFMNQVEVQEQIDLAQHFDADQIGRNCLQLHSGRILYSCEQVENMIDRILLCRRNTEHNVQKLVKKLEICREINSLRVLFTRSGGREEGYGDVLRKKKLINKKRMLQRYKLREEQRKRRLVEKRRKNKEKMDKIKQQIKADGLQSLAPLEVVDEEEEEANNVESSDEEQEIKINDEELKELEDIGDDEDNIASYLKTPVSLKLADYDEFSKEWLQRVTEWNTHVEILRSSSALMNYFTINNVRTLIEKINRIIKHAKHNVVRGKSKVKVKKSGKISGMDSYIDGLNPDILQRHILPHFQFVNPRLQVEDLIKCLKKWKVMDESSNTALTAFDKCFRGIIVRKLHDTKQFTRNVSPLEEGKPNLVVTSRNTALFTALKMYLQRKLIPNAEHILICQNTSSAEEIEAMIFRCIHATARHSKIPPLYCLIYPEDLDAGVLDATINIFNNRLLSPRALEQTSKIPYAFSVISGDSENRLSQMLVQFKLTQSIQLQKEECTNLLKYLFHDSLHEFVQRYNPFVQAKPFVELYTSKEVGMGKSYVIQQQVKQCQAQYIRIPFNGDDVDLDFLVDRCWSYHSYSENLENDMEKALVMDALSEADKKDNNVAEDQGKKVKKVSSKYGKLKSGGYEKNVVELGKIIYHLDISANAGEDLNNMLFNLLFLRHIHTPNKKCFSVDDNMGFLIEIPTELSGVHALNVLKQKTAQNSAVKIQNKATLKQPSDVFYLLYKPMEFPTMSVSNDTNLFHYDYDCHYAGKFLRSFYGNELKQNDPDPTTVANMTDDEIHALIYKHFQNIAESSPIHYKAFFKFLSQQFTQVVNSIFLRNEFNDGGQIAWKHWVTSSIIDIGKDFCRRLYGGVVHKRRNEAEHKGKTSEELIDESTGKEHFYLCERWKNAREPMFLLNQTCDFGYGGPDGSISALVSDKYTLPQEKRTALENSKFILIPWNEEEERRRHMLLQTNFMNELPQRKQEKINLFLRILGLDVENNVIHQSILISLLFEDPFANYALTFDNILKMVAIFFRVKSNIPVILMGETGCGKTSLLRYLAKAASVEFCQADVHGGFTATHIRSKMSEWIQIAKRKQNEVAVNTTSQDVWVFLDEVNTSPDIGWFKEIVCDHSLDGTPLPYNMKVIAACNPYRRRKLNMDIGDEKSNKKHKKIINEQFKNWMAASGSDDPLAQFMYRVYPLAPTMKEYVWMFGSLSELDELQYVCEMVNNTVRKLPQEVQKNFSDWQRRRLIDAIVKSQEFVRDVLRDAAYVSLRDVARCLSIIQWLMSNELKFATSNSWIERATVQALALVYYFRLDSINRIRYAKRITPDVCGRIAWFNNRDFQTVLNDEIEELCAAFEIPPGVALNKSLKENLFMLFLCIMTQTPVILVGKPGSSKTLAVSIIRDSLSEINIAKVQELGLPVQCIHIISFQCSKQSRAQGIRKRWEQALGHQLRDERVRLVLLLDEVGLAEHSPHRPLKVLHQLLEDPEISFVGLSNWPLDAAKMNRANMHLCPEHTRQDLEETAKQMLQQYKSMGNLNIERMNTELYALSKVYLDVLSNLQPRVDFFGARDFYSLVRYFLSEVQRANADNDNENLMKGFLRNFGGIEDNLIHQLLSEIIERHIGIEKKQVQNVIQKYPPLVLVKSNICDKRKLDSLIGTDNFMISRHCMVITESAHSWQVLLDQDVLSHSDTFIFGSEFSRDKASSITFYANLNRVMNCMETGKTVVLHNLDDIHESLYDMLNQRYTVTRAGKMYCRVALGAESRTCFIDPLFKCIVLVSKYDAHKSGRVPIAFLNRFEKQLISYYSSLPYRFRSDVLLKLEIAICSKFAASNKKVLNKLFPGFCNDTLPSVLSALINDVDVKENKEKEEQDDNKMIQDSVCALLNVALPESVIEATVKTKKSPIEYLPTLQDTIKKYENDQEKMLMILTYDFESSLPKNADFLKNTTLKNLDEFNKADEFDAFIRKHFTSSVHKKNKKKTKPQQKLEQKQPQPQPEEKLEQKKAETEEKINVNQIEMKGLIKTDSLGDDEVINNKNNDGNKLSKIDKISMEKATSTEEKEKEKEKEEKNNKLKKTLLLQYRHGSAGVQHFIHIKHMIELAYYQSEMDPNEQHQVIFVVHLRRDTPSESFPLVLSRRWHMVFIDSLQQNAAIKLESIATQSIGDIFEAEGIGILSSICRRALSHLQFSTSVAPQKEIERLLFILKPNTKYKLFQDCILNRMASLLSVDKLNIPIARLVVDNVRNIHDSGQWMRGSFYERFSDIVQKIVMVTLTNVLRSVYINNNFDILFNINIKNEEKDKLLHNLYIQLFSNKDLVEISTITSTISLILQNKPILVDVPHEYNAQFPFSSSINQWCSAQKSFLRSFRENEEKKEDIDHEEDGKEDEKYDIEGSEGGGPGSMENIKYKNKEKHLETARKLQRTKQISDFLKQFMRGSHDPLPLLTELPHNLSELYATDLIMLHDTQLPIDKLSSKKLIKLASRYLMTVTAAICGLPPDLSQFTAKQSQVQISNEGGGGDGGDNNDNDEPGKLGDLQPMQHQDSLGDDEDIPVQIYMSKDAIEEREKQDENRGVNGVRVAKEKSFISIPELQATIWTQSEFLMHFLTISSLLDDDKLDKIHDILSYKDLYSSRSSLLYALQFVLEFLNSSFNDRKYDKLVKTQQSIPYLLTQVNKWLIAVTNDSNNSDTLPSQIELDYIINNLNKKWKCLKLKMLAVKHIRIAQKNKENKLISKNKHKMRKKKESKSGLFGKLFAGIMEEEEMKDEQKDEEKDDISCVNLFERFSELINSNSLIHKDTFCEILKLLLFEINKYGNIVTDKYLLKIFSNTLCDYLSLIDDMENVQILAKHHLDFASCLLDLIVRHTKIIGMDIGKNLVWNDIAKLQLVRRLLNLCHYDRNGNVLKLINGALFMYNKRECGWDHDLNTLIVRAFEERRQTKNKNNKNKKGEGDNNAKIEWITNKTQPLKQLECLAQIKIELAYYIEYLSNIIVDVVNIDDIFDQYKLEIIFYNKIHYLLTLITDKDWQYSLHIWFLKQMYNLRGMEWTEVLICNKRVRKTCPIFSKSQVFNQLKRASANIPSLDIFALIGDRYYMYSSAFHLASHKKQIIGIEYQENSERDRLAVIAALFSEIYLLPAANKRELIGLQIVKDKIFAELLSKIFLNCTAKSFEYEFINRLLNGFNHRGCAFFYNKKTSIEDVMIMRLAIHLFVCITSKHKNPLYLLYMDPLQFLDGYLISMPPDMLALVHNAIENKKTRIWLCPKGHPYLIGECGRPTVESKCHCGEVIGGKSHNPVENVKPVDNYIAKSPKGYVLTGNEDEQKNVESFRECKPYVVRCMRLFMHLTMLLHQCSTQKSGLSKLIHQKETNLNKFLWSQIRSDINLLCSITSANLEDVCIGIHLLLCDLMDHNIFASIDAKHDIKNEVDRDTFEQLLNAFIEKQLIYHRKHNTILNFRNENKNAAHLRLLMSEILEQKNLKLKSNTRYRLQYVPHLFLRCQSVTLASFFTFVGNDIYNENERLYPNLWRIIHARPLFWCLKYIPYISKWLKLIYQRYLRKKTLDECREITIADILHDAQTNKWGDINEWKIAWNKFRECWNYISSLTRKIGGDEIIEHECKTLVIPELSSNNEHVSMIYSLPNDIGDGILILEIIKNLQNVQNEFLHSYSNKFGVQNRQTLFNLRSDHCISISREGLLDIILSHSQAEINYGISMISGQPAITFDLEAIENEIISSYIFGRYPMEIDIRSFEFMGGQNTSSLIGLISQIISQETLSFDIWQTFDNQFETSFQRRKALDIFEECISFLSKMSYKQDKNIEIFKFMQNILQMNKSEYKYFNLNQNDKKLLLKHIKSLWTYLTQTLARHDLKRSKAPKHTLHKYKIEITNDIENKLNKFIKNIPLGLLSKIVLKWKNQLQSYGNIQYNIHTTTVNQFLFIDDDIVLPKKIIFPTISLQYFATAFEFVAQKFYTLSK